MLRVKQAVKERGFTIKYVAEKLGKSSPAISDAINGNPTFDTLVQIASAIGAHVTDLIERPASGNIVCPYCGGKLKISKE